MKEKFNEIIKMILICNKRNECNKSYNEDICKYYNFCHGINDLSIDTIAENLCTFLSTI